MTLLDIREYYTDKSSGEEKPGLHFWSIIQAHTSTNPKTSGKKGISLTEEQVIMYIIYIVPLILIFEYDSGNNYAIVHLLSVTFLLLRPKKPSLVPMMTKNEPMIIL
jgi:hypothetical protein